MLAANATKNISQQMENALFVLIKLIIVSFVTMETPVISAQVKKYSSRTTNVLLAVALIKIVKLVKNETLVLLVKINQSTLRIKNAHPVAILTIIVPDASKKINVWHVILRNLQ